MLSMTASLLLSAFVQTCLVTCERNRCDSNCWIITPRQSSKMEMTWGWSYLAFAFHMAYPISGLVLPEATCLTQRMCLAKAFFLPVLQLCVLPLSCCKVGHKRAGMKQSVKKRWCDNLLKAELFEFSCSCVRILTCLVMHVGQSLEMWI